MEYWVGFSAFVFLQLWTKGYMQQIWGCAIVTILPGLNRRSGQKPAGQVKGSGTSQQELPVLSWDKMGKEDGGEPHC